MVVSEEGCNAESEEMMPADHYMIRGIRVERYQYELLECAVKLQGETSGASQGCLSPAESIRYYDFILCRLNDWYPSFDWCEKWDEACKTLAIEAIRFFRSRGYEYCLKWCNKHGFFCPRYIYKPTQVEEVWEEGKLRW